MKQLYFLIALLLSNIVIADEMQQWIEENCRPIEATDGDLRAIEIILDRIDGKVVQENKIDGNMGHDFNIPIRVITGIDDDYEPIEVTPEPEEGRRIRKVSREQAKIEDERGWKGISMKFEGTEGMFDDDGNMKDYEERMEIIRKRDM